MFWIWFAPLLAIVLFLMIICVRAAMFVPKKLTENASKPSSDSSALSAEVVVDRERAFKNLQEMIKVKTITPESDDLTVKSPYEKEFEEFKALLPRLYPLLHKHSTCEYVGPTGILYKWEGKSSDSPTIYMAHYDVVPVEEDMWEKPPFSAERADGEIWGRGTLDTKGTLCAALEAAESLLEQGFVPKQDVYFAFGGDEEQRSADAPAIVELLKSRGVRPGLVLDEGGAVVENVFPGVKQQVAVIGTGEKGKLNVEFSISEMGGHAATPPPRTSIGALARAITAVEENQFPATISKPVVDMFDTLGRHSSFAYKLIFANLFCFKGILFSLCKKKGGELNALVRTTVAFTQMRGSDAPNVLPPVASVTANMRLMSPDTSKSVLKILQEKINNESITITGHNAVEPSPFSNTDSEGYARLCGAISATWPEAIISPYMMIAASDSRHFCKISDVVLRFSAMYMSTDDRKRIHSNNERINEERFIEAVSFYHRMLRES